MVEMSDETQTDEVHLLKGLCGNLDIQRKKSHQEAIEWQNFGRFTANVLRKEVEGFERKLRVLQERLDVLVRENGELKEKSRGERAVEDSCVQLVKASDRGNHGVKSKAPVHSMCAEEMNSDTSPPLHYPGITSENTLRDKKTLSVPDTKDADAAVTMLQKRLERVEAEKLELVKSLSAAHLLTATQAHQSSFTGHTTTSPSPVTQQYLSPEFQALLESCKAQEGQGTSGASTQNSGLDVPPNVILQAVSLLDMC